MIKSKPKTEIMVLYKEGLESFILISDLTYIQVISSCLSYHIISYPIKVQYHAMPSKIFSCKK